MKNRHDRRRAERLRRRQTGYLHRILIAVGSGDKPPPGVRHLIIAHDDRCAYWRGGGCDCVPDISTSGPDGVTVIDEHGVARKVAKS